MSILSSTKSGNVGFEKKKEELQERIRVWLEEQGINNKNYKIMQDNLIMKTKIYITTHFLCCTW